jgi:uncharacterized protein YceH (UPF0502 family)
LISKEPETLVVRLPRQPGQKETRFAHLLAGEVSVDYTPESDSPREGTSGRQGSAERISRLEQEVERLSREMEGLAQQFVEFKKQFE